MLLCQFPLCIRQVFIWDEQLKVNLCDVHSEVTPSQLKIASTSNCNSSLIFDGTSKWGENFVIILRAVVDFEPRQILAKLGRYKRSFKEKDGRHELSSAIITSTIGDLQLDASKCVAKHCDCASVNFNCLNSIAMNVFSNGENVGCFSHTLAHCGDDS